MGWTKHSEDDRERALDRMEHGYHVEDAVYSPMVNCPSYTSLNTAPKATRMPTPDVPKKTAKKGTKVQQKTHTHSKNRQNYLKFVVPKGEGQNVSR